MASASPIRFEPITPPFQATCTICKEPIPANKQAYGHLWSLKQNPSSHPLTIVYHIYHGRCLEDTFHNNNPNCPDCESPVDNAQDYSTKQHMQHIEQSYVTFKEWETALKEGNLDLADSLFAGRSFPSYLMEKMLIATAKHGHFNGTFAILAKFDSLRPEILGCAVYWAILKENATLLPTLLTSRP